MNGTSSGSAPLSPATESRDKERFTLLLEINQELLYESIQLMNTKTELKKEQAAESAGGNPNGQNTDNSEEEKLILHDYTQYVYHILSPTYMYPALLTGMFLGACGGFKATSPTSRHSLTGRVGNYHHVPPI